MKRIGYLFLTGTIMVLLSLLAGCAQEGQAGQENADATVGGQAAAGLAPSPEVVDPLEADSESSAAGETPSILGSTPEPGQVGAWERSRFHDVWDVGYPDGWQVDRPSNNSVVLSGAYGERQYQVVLVRPMDVSAEALDDWVQADLAAIGQDGASRLEVGLSEVEAMKVTNVTLPDQAEGACPSVRVYAWSEALAQPDQFLIITVTQEGDDQECDPAMTERLADALVAELRR